MKDIKFPLDPLDLLQFTLDLNEELRKVDENFKELSSAAVTTPQNSKLTTDLGVSDDPYPISGDLFTPKLTSKPTGVGAVQWDGDTGLDVTQLVQGFVKNGDYYDVIMGASPDDAFLNVTITVFN